MPQVQNKTSKEKKVAITKNDEKSKRAENLATANKELLFQNEEKEKRAAELVIANKELHFQNEEKQKPAPELIVANKELAFQNEEKEKRAAELILANKELAFKNEEKEKRAAELIVANKELAFQNEEKEKRAAELINANRLYSFLSQINQTIVHSKNEEIVFSEACRIAFECGKFKVAWIGTVDERHKEINIVEECGMPPEDIPTFTNINYEEGGAQSNIVTTGHSYVCNDIENDPAMITWKLFAAGRGWRSCIVLPIKRSGKVVAIFNIISSEKNFFNAGEISLLNEASGDISFALEVIEKDRHRKQMERKVAHNELRLKQAQAIAHYGNWELNFSTGSGIWSDEACRIFGLAPDDNIQSYESWLSFIHPDDRELATKSTKGEHDRLTNTAFHHRIVRKGGEVRYIYSQAHLEFDAQGRPIGLYSVVHDVTETRKAEEALAQSEANLREIMNLMPQSISAKDYTGKYVFVNNSFANLLGRAPDELINKSIRETLPVGNNTDAIFRQDLEVIMSGKTKTFADDSFEDNKGNHRLFYTVKVPFTVAGTNERAVLGVSMDITEQKQAETERAKMIADIVQRNKNLEQFSYIVSHNLRAPVANILGLTNVIETLGLKNEEQQSIVEFISMAAKNLDNVIKDINYILELKHEVSENKQCVAFATLIDEIKSGIDNVIREEKVTIKVNFTEASEILTIKSYLYSILYNLISNSIKYRRHDFAPVIEIVTLRTENKIRLVFKDNGLGIDMKQKGKEIFGLYKRFHNHVEGKGMGLFMVKTQIETLGGTISMESEVNKGTTFTLEFEINK